MNKPVASKLITNNNYFSFFVKNVDKLKDEDFIDYFKKLETPHESICGGSVITYVVLGLVSRLIFK